MDYYLNLAEFGLNLYGIRASISGWPQALSHQAAPHLVPPAPAGARGGGRS
jgi:hypothetical protein